MIINSADASTNAEQPVAPASEESWTWEPMQVVGKGGSSTVYKARVTSSDNLNVEVNQTNLLTHIAVMNDIRRPALNILL